MKYEVGKWYPWTGVVRPVHRKTLVTCKFVDGEESLPEEAGRSVFIWSGEDIVAFKVVEEYKEPREFWILYSGQPDVYSHGVYDCLEDARDHAVWSDEVIKVREVKE